jgi:hypothetical protein
MIKLPSISSKMHYAAITTLAFLSVAAMFNAQSAPLTKGDVCAREGVLIAPCPTGTVCQGISQQGTNTSVVFLCSALIDPVGEGQLCAGPSIDYIPCINGLVCNIVGEVTMSSTGTCVRQSGNAGATTTGSGIAPTTIFPGGNSGGNSGIPLPSVPSGSTASMPTGKGSANNRNDNAGASSRVLISSIGLATLGLGVATVLTVFG